MAKGSDRLQKFYSRLRLEEADVLLHFGWGPGDCGEILRERAKPGARIIVFEPNEKVFKQSPPFQDPRFQFVIGPKVDGFFDEWGLGGRETDQFLWVESPSATGEHHAIAESLRLRFKTHLRDRAANLLTHIRNGGIYFQNVIGNFEYQRDADAGRLFGRFRNVPLVIVSAGPSLDDNIHQLCGFEDRCFILSVDTAMRPLLAAGITPHAVIIADPSELNARHVVGALPESTYLVAEQAVHASAFQAATRRFLFGLGLFPDPLFSKFGFGKSRLDAWGSVATSALDLASRMGANPIIFVGQDFAYSWNREYARNTIFHGAYFDVREKGKAKARDIYGNEAYTTENLVAYRDFFVRRIAQSPDIRFINATEGGILTEGVEFLSLRNALKLCATRAIDVDDRLRECHRPSRVTAAALEHLQNVLTEKRPDCGCLDSFLELTAKEHLLRRNDVEIEKTIQWGAQWLHSQQ